MSKTSKIKRRQFRAGAVAAGPAAATHATAVVKKGEPALIDVVSQPR